MFAATTDPHLRLLAANFGENSWQLNLSMGGSIE
jgi:hypothetical protein